MSTAIAAGTTPEPAAPEVATVASRTEPLPDRDEIARALQLLKQPEDVVELRCPKTNKGTVVGLYTDANELVKDTYELSASGNIRTNNVYWTLQGAQPMTCPNGFNAFAKNGDGVNDEMVNEYRWLPIDLDPTRPSDTCSTDSEKAAAYAQALMVREYLNGLGMSSILADSGNGYHLLVKVSLSANAANIALVHSLLAGLAAKFGTSKVGIDVKVSNPSRIWKVYGTVARKGESTAERPYRVARILDAPTVSVVPEAKLRELLTTLGSVAAPSSSTVNASFPEKSQYPRNADGLIGEGNRHHATLQQLGVWHEAKQYLEFDSRYKAITKWRNENIVSPRSEMQEKKVRQAVRDSLGWEPSKKLEMTQPQVASSPVAAASDDESGVVVKDGITYAVIQVNKDSVHYVALDTSETAERPKFPAWVMNGTSIYENLVKPAVETSSKYSELVFVPAMQLMMNYLSRRVYIEMHPTDLNLFVGLVSPYGEFFKSSSCTLAYDYMTVAGICGKHGKDTKNADAKTLIVQAGSPEGLGIAMQKVNSKQAILFNDELGKLVSKAGIEGSGFSSDLLIWHGGADFGNSITNTRNNFSFPAGTYTFGWLWCTTDRNFNHYWPKLAGIASGIEDRMFFVVSPEKPREPGLFQDPSLTGAAKTRELIDRALNQKTFQIEDVAMFEKRIKGLDPRSLNLLVKLSLYFAIDLGLKAVDDDCAERARALVDYRNQAAAFLEPIEAENAEGRLMKEILRELRQNKGKMPYRVLLRALDYGRFGRTWDTAYGLLRNHGDIVEFQERRTRGKRKTHMVGIVLHDADE